MDKVIISENKVLEYNEKAWNDTELLFSKIKADDLESNLKFVENNPDAVHTLNTQYFGKGRTIWLQLKVEDSLLSGSLMKWLYTSSLDGARLHALGCTLEEIQLVKPSGYSDDEKQAIRKLYEAAFGNE